MLEKSAGGFCSQQPHLQLEATIVQGALISDYQCVLRVILVWRMMVENSAAVGSSIRVRFCGL